MQIILVRHAEAYPLGEQGATTDAARPLTDLGHRQAAALAAALKARGVVPAIVVSSPLVRAKQTADPLLDLLPDDGDADEPAICEYLDPERYRPRKVAKFAAGFAGGPVVLVGHNPSISDFARWLLGGARGCVEMDKGAALLAECGDGPGKGNGVLRWFVAPEWVM